MPRPPHCLAVLTALVLLTASRASALSLVMQEPPPQHRLVYRNLLEARLNPLGLLDEARLSYRYRLYHAYSRLLRDNFVSVGLAPGFSPAFGRLGVVAELQPLSILQIWGMYEFIGNFGTFRQLQSFPSARSNFSDTELYARDELPAGAALRPHANTGTQLTLGATLELKVGPVVARSLFRLVRPDMSLREGDRVFYDIYYDVLAPNRGWYFVNDADLLYQTGSGLTVGLRWASSHAFYGPSHFSPGEPQENLNTTHRLGPVVAYTFSEQEGARFNAPTVLLMVNWWLAHRYRTGADSSAFLPYLALGFSFSGDLLPVKRPEDAWGLPAASTEFTWHRDDVAPSVEPVRPYQPGPQDKVVLRGEIHFEQGSNELPDVVPLLDQAVLRYSQQPTGAFFVVEGHADTEGSDRSDMSMSIRRAQAVRLYLISQGCSANQIRIRGFGSEWPLSDNPATEQEHQLNRRVEVLVISQKEAH